MKIMYGQGILIF